MTRIISQALAAPASASLVITRSPAHHSPSKKRRTADSAPVKLASRPIWLARMGSPVASKSAVATGPANFIAARAFSAATAVSTAASSAAARLRSAIGISRGDGDLVDLVLIHREHISRLDGDRGID